jgi:TonB-dependent receptor
VQFGAGLAWQQIRLAEHADTRRWRYRYHYNDAGAGSLDPDYTVAHFLASGVKIDPRLGDTITTLPRFNIGLAADDLRDHPDDWWNDEYYYLEANRDGTRDLRENIHAAYLMARTRLGPLGLLAGARAEYSRLDGRAWERTNEPLPPASERILDPAGSIAKTYGPAMQHTRPSGHRDLFPSLHLTHTLRKNLVARASWSTSIGRPPPRQFIARMTYNEGLQTVTRSNPGLAPEYGNNFDLSLEYYLKPVGLLSAGVFRKQISRFIYTSRGKIITAADPEYDPFFHGYVENTMRNGGRAAINGLELSYEQQLRFLPAPFDGLRINLNYTRMDMEANYDSGLPRTTKEVPNFVPTAFNARLRYNYRGLWCGIAYNYTDSKLLTYSDTPAYLEYRKGRGQLDLNASYRIKPFLEVFVTLNNITDEPYINCIGRKDRLYRVIYNGPNLNLGLSGRF